MGSGGSARYCRQANWLTIRMPHTSATCREIGKKAKSKDPLSQHPNCLGVIWSSRTGRLVLVSFMHYCNSHPSLINLVALRAHRYLKDPGELILERGLPAAMLSAVILSAQDLGCHWRDNRNTRGASTPVLCMEEQLSPNFQRPRQIGTEPSHDVETQLHQSNGEQPYPSEPATAPGCDETIQVPNSSVDVNLEESACYPRRPFPVVSDGPSIQNHRITKPLSDLLDALVKYPSAFIRSDCGPRLR